MKPSPVLSIFVGCAFAASIQKPLIQRDYGIPLLAFPAFTEDWVYYGATFGIGSDQGQIFNAIIDINAAGTYIESTRCRSQDCCPQDHMQYNHSRSISYHTNGIPANVTSFTAVVEGIISHDTLRLGNDLVIPNHTFVETTWSKTRLPYLHDSIIGLSQSRQHYNYPQLGSNVSFPGIFEEYVALNGDRHKKRNKFSLLAPYFPGALGDLSLGTVHSDLYEGELARHDIYPPGADTWQLKGPTVRVISKSGKQLVERNLGDYVVHFDSTLPGIAFPRDSGIKDLLNQNPLWQECDDTLDSLPTLVLDFDGQEIALEARDYFISAHDLWGAERCRFLVGEMDQGSTDTRGDEQIVFGTDFLKMVYAVFDWEDRSISFAKANRKVIPFAGDVEELKQRFRPISQESICYNSYDSPFSLPLKSYVARLEPEN